MVLKAREQLKHIFDIDSLTREEIIHILNVAENFKARSSSSMSLSGKIAGLMFFQSSTRTQVGFDVAMKRLGGDTTFIAETKFQPGMTGEESLNDTVKVVSAYCDVLVIRHPETEMLRQSLDFSSVPVINAGSGTEHHPTQTLIDLFCIRSHFQKIEGLRIGLVGDLVASRSARSLVRALKHWPPAELRMMAPRGRELPEDVLASLPANIVSSTNRLDTLDLDILYMAGLPNIDENTHYTKTIKSGLTLTHSKADTFASQGIIMCPLPRIDEIETAVDSLSGAVYFNQSADGLFVRMAALQEILLRKV